MKTLFISLLLASFAAQAQQDTKVLTTATGKKYHTHKECQYLKHSTDIKTITLAQAEKDGKTICSRCKAKDERGGKK